MQVLQGLCSSLAGTAKGRDGHSELQLALLCFLLAPTWELKSAGAVAWPLVQNPPWMDLAAQSLGNVCSWLRSARPERQQLKLHLYLQFVLDHKKSISVRNKGYKFERTHLST